MDQYLFLLPIALALIVGVISPGPSFILVAQTAVTKSRACGVATSAGMGVGVAVFALVAAAGLYVVLENVPWVYTAIKILGGLYLGYLAVKIWRSASSTVISTDEEAESSGSGKETSLWLCFVAGLLTQLSNPKTAIIFVSIFAAFMPEAVPSYSYILLCGMAFVIDFVWYSIVSLLLSTARAQSIYDRYQSYISRVAGAVMAALGLKLIFT